MIGQHFDNPPRREGVLDGVGATLVNIGQAHRLIGPFTLQPVEQPLGQPQVFTDESSRTAALAVGPRVIFCGSTGALRPSAVKNVLWTAITSQLGHRVTAQIMAGKTRPVGPCRASGKWRIVSGVGAVSPRT